MTAAADTLAAVADRLTRAADRIEELNWDGSGEDARWLPAGSQVVTDGARILAEATPEDVRRIAAFDPYTVAALPELLRSFRDVLLAGDDGPVVRHLTAPFGSFARRLLGEEETGG